jgi:N-acetylmuramoyl-L-alanine amidase
MRSIGRLASRAFFVLGSLWVAPAWGGSPWVALDAGHTLKAQGSRAAGDGRSELAFNQDFALETQKALLASGMRVKMANTPARKVENFKERVAAGAGADFFLSIHHDSAREQWLERVSGRWEDTADRFKGFALLVDPADAKGVECARRIGQALIQEGEKPSLYHADPVFGEGRTLVDALFGVHAYPSLAVARLRHAPMTLLEVGVIVNPGESKRLRTAEFRQRAARAVARGLSACLGAAP